MKNNTPTLTIHFGLPDKQEIIPLTLLRQDTMPSVKSTLHLPFQLAQISLVLRALNSRQYPDYPTVDRLIMNGEDRKQLISSLKMLDLWDTTKGAVSVDVHRRVGQFLGNALLADINVRHCFECFYQDAQRVDCGELILRFTPEARILTSLPWEVAYDRTQSLLMRHGFVLSCIRTIDYDEEHPILTYLSRQQLHILTVTPRTQMSEADRTFEQLARIKMHQAFQHLPDQVTIEQLTQATMEALRQRLEQQPTIDVLDFFGHGTLTKDGGALVLENAQGGRDEVLAHRISSLPHLPSVIVLHACQSALVDTSEPLNSLALALNIAGVQCVLAMQMTVRTPAIAHTIVPIFYHKLATYQSIQQAVTSVRQALHTDEQDGVSWYIPTLYLRQKEPEPLPLLKKPTHYPSNPFASDIPTYLIDRKVATRTMWERINAPSNLSIIGSVGSGKTALLHLIKNEQHKLIQQSEVIWLPLERRVRLVDAQLRLARELGGEKAKATNLLMLLKQRKRLIILIDDIGQLDKGERGLEVRLWLRLLTQDPSTTIRLVTTSVKPLNEIFKADEAESDTYSPFHHVMNEPLLLTAFTDEESHRYVEETLKGTPFNLQDFADILNKRRVPRDLKAACRERYDALCRTRQ